MCRLKGVGSTYLDRYVWVIERERVSERVSERVRERERERGRGIWQSAPCKADRNPLKVQQDRSETGSNFKFIFRKKYFETENSGQTMGLFSRRR